MHPKAVHYLPLHQALQEPALQAAASKDIKQEKAQKMEAGDKEQA